MTADWLDFAGTGVRVRYAEAFARGRLSLHRFGREWGELLGSLVPAPIPAREQGRLSVLRNECPHGSKVPGCSCDDFNCAKFGTRKTRRQCYSCLLEPEAE